MIKRNLACCGAVFGLSIVAGAAELDAELADVAARIDYGYYTNDVTLIRAAADVARTGQGPWQRYLSAYAAFRELGLIAGSGRSSSAAVDACLRDAEAAADEPTIRVEAMVLVAACSSIAAAREPLRTVLHQRRLGQALDAARASDPGNPRLLLVAYWVDDETGPDSLEKALAILRNDDDYAIPGWGEADILVALGQERLNGNELRAARDYLEEALLIAPDFARARALQRRVLDRATR